MHTHIRTNTYAHTHTPQTAGVSVAGDSIVAVAEAVDWSLVVVVLDAGRH